MHSLCYSPGPCPLAVHSLLEEMGGQPEAKLLPADPAGEARCLEWLSWISTDLHGIGCRQLWRPHRFVHRSGAP